VKDDKLWWNEPECLHEKVMQKQRFSGNFSPPVKVNDDSLVDLLSKFSLNKTMRMCAHMGIKVPVQRSKSRSTSERV
jgi:hypothetical protein